MQRVAGGSKSSVRESLTNVPSTGGLILAAAPRGEPRVSEPIWNAWVEKGAVLWHWSVERDMTASDLPFSPSRGDTLHGVALTESGARKKARKWLDNRIEWSRPRADRRQFITLHDPSHSGRVDS